MWLSNTIPVGTSCYTRAIATKTTLELVENRVVLVEIAKLQNMQINYMNSIEITNKLAPKSSLDTNCLKLTRSTQIFNVRLIRSKDNEYSIP
jgi:cytidylate kinase